MWYINKQWRNISFTTMDSLSWHEIKTSTESKCSFTVKRWNKYFNHKFSVMMFLDYNSAIIYKFEDCINTMLSNWIHIIFFIQHHSEILKRNKSASPAYNFNFTDPNTTTPHSVRFKYNCLKQNIDCLIPNMSEILHYISIPKAIHSIL